jgi:hypothetical protein
MTHGPGIPLRTASRSSGPVARQLRFGDLAVPAPPRLRGRPALRLALARGTLRGPEKYKLLEHRRRQAQIKARRLLAMAEESDASRAGAGSNAGSGERHHESR